MKKIFLSLGVVIASAFYVLFNGQGTSSVAISAPTPIAINNGQQIILNGSTTAGSNSIPIVPSPTPVATKTPASTPKPTPKPTPAPAPAPAPKPKPSGLYTDGAYTGSAADAYYGMVQVKAVIQNGKIADVQFLQYPNTHSTSVYINSQAMPYLKQEAIQAQSANVNIVSGATDTSMAFQQSLASALAQAKI